MTIFKYLSAVIGGWSNKESIIRQGSQTTFPDFPRIPTPDLLNPEEFREFTISWAGGQIAVYRAVNCSAPIIEYTHSNPFSIEYIGFSTGWGSTGEFLFCDFGKPYN